RGATADLLPPVPCGERLERDAMRGVRSAVRPAGGSRAAGAEGGRAEEGIARLDRGGDGRECDLFFAALPAALRADRGRGRGDHRVYTCGRMAVSAVGGRRYGEC